MRRLLSLICIVLATAAPSAGQVDVSTWVPEVVGLDVITARAFANHPILSAASAAVARERSLGYQASRKPNPVFGYAASEVGNDGAAGQQGVFLSQNLTKKNLRAASGMVHTSAADTYSQRIELLRLQTMLRVQLAYLEVVAADRQTELLGRMHASLTDSIGSIEKLIEAGELGDPPLLQAKLERGRNEIAIQQTQATSQYARQRIAAITGTTEFDSIIDFSIIDDVLPAADAEAVWNEIASQSPELAIARAAHNETLWKARREELVPLSELQTQWTLQQDFATNDAVLGVQIGVALPLHDDNRGAINAARADTRRTHFEVDAVMRDLARRLTIVLGEQERGLRAMKSIQSQLLPLAQSNLEGVAESFEAGESSYLELLTAQRAFISLRLDMLKHRVDVARAKFKLDARLVELR